jgi:hypothetical protein
MANCDYATGSHIGSYIAAGNPPVLSCVSCSISASFLQYYDRWLAYQGRNAYFFLKPWTAFVLLPLLRFSPKAMNTSQAICRMREVLRRQPKALSIEDSYIGWLRRYMRVLREMPEGLSSEKKLEQFLTDLAVSGWLKVEG